MLVGIQTSALGDIGAVQCPLTKCVPGDTERQQYECKRQVGIHKTVTRMGHNKTMKMIVHKP